MLRFWETRFPQIKPLKRAGGRRYYRPEDVAALLAIKARLYDQGYTIKGVQKLIRAHGLAALRDAPDSEAPLFSARVEPPMTAPEPAAPKGRAAAADPALTAGLRAALAELGEARRVLALAAQRP